VLFKLKDTVLFKLKDTEGDLEPPMFHTKKAKNKK
jgi:hypothetical protein